MSTNIEAYLGKDVVDTPSPEERELDVKRESLIILATTGQLKEYASVD